VHARDDESRAWTLGPRDRTGGSLLPSLSSQSYPTPPTAAVLGERTTSWRTMADSETAPAAHPRVSAVIVTHNARSHLKLCLESLYAHHDNTQIEVIVVDNESSDGTAEWMAHHWPETRFLQIEPPPGNDFDTSPGLRGALRPGNPGFAAANNLGLAVAHGDHLLILNPDTIFHEASCLMVADYLDQHPHVGAASCQLLNSDGSIQLSCRAFPTIGSLVWKCRPRRCPSAVAIQAGELLDAHVVSRYGTLGRPTVGCVLHGTPGGCRRGWTA